MTALFDQTLAQLDGNFATRTIRSKIADPSYDQSFGEDICQLVFKLCHEDTAAYTRAVNDFIHFSLEFLQLQVELDKTGSYRLHSYQEAFDTVYNNPEVMTKRYLNGLLLSQAFWINHYKMFAFFRQNFCLGNATQGSMLEVPIGTGIYSSEFIRHNPGWISIGYDISESAVHFAKQLIQAHNGLSMDIRKENIFDLSTEQKYDNIIRGELLEHLEKPTELLAKLKDLLADDGKLFLTTAIWAASVDHIYLFKSAQEVRDMILPYFKIESEIVLNVFDKKPDDEKTPISYACVLTKI